MSGKRLIVFVDRSGGVYALIAVEEGRLYRLAARLTWVEHFKKLRRRENRGTSELSPGFEPCAGCWHTPACSTSWRRSNGSSGGLLGG